MVKTSPSNIGSVGSIPGRRAKIPHTRGKKKKKKNPPKSIKWNQYCKKLNKGFKNGLKQKQKQKNLEMGHGGSIYTREIDKHYKSELVLLMFRL